MRSFNDYHIHTCLRPIDDGDDNMTPEFLVDYFKNRNAEEFGLSPHFHFDADACLFEKFLTNAQSISRRHGIQMLAGVETECTNADGALTLPDELADRLDYVIASGEHFNCGGVVKPPLSADACMNFHMNLMMKLADNPRVDVLAHPFAGLILLTTEGHLPDNAPITNLDAVTDEWLEQFAAKLRKTGTAVELNGFFTLTYPSKLRHENRADYTERYRDIYRKLIDRGVIIAPASDAHTRNNLKQFDDAVQWLRDMAVPEEQIWHPKHRR